MKQEDLTLSPVVNLNVSNRTAGTGTTSQRIVDLTAYRVNPGLNGLRTTRYQRMKAPPPIVPEVAPDRDVRPKSAGRPCSSSSFLSVNQNYVRVRV